MLNTSVNESFTFSISNCKKIVKCFSIYWIQVRQQLLFYFWKVWVAEQYHVLTVYIQSDTWNAPFKQLFEFSESFSVPYMFCVSRCVWAQQRAPMCWSAGRSICAPRRSTRSPKPSWCCFLLAAFTKWERCSTGRREKKKTLESIELQNVKHRLYHCVNSTQRLFTQLFPFAFSL